MHKWAHKYNRLETSAVVHSLCVTFVLVPSVMLSACVCGNDNKFSGCLIKMSHSRNEWFIVNIAKFCVHRDGNIIKHSSA